jgi:hypothetical protein
MDYSGIGYFRVGYSGIGYSGIGYSSIGYSRILTAAAYPTRQTDRELICI